MLPVFRPSDTVIARSSWSKQFETIAAAPFARHANVTAMKGEQDAFRLRQGGWRAIYRIIRSDDEMRVVLVDVRGSIYR